MKEGRKFLAFFMIVCMMAAFVPAAFAEEEPQITSVNVVVNDDFGSMAWAFGNQVDVEAEYEGTEGTITVKTGEGSQEKNDIAALLPPDVTSVTVNVKSDVNQNNSNGAAVVVTNHSSEIDTTVYLQNVSSESAESSATALSAENATVKAKAVSARQLPTTTKPMPLWL